MDIWGFAPYESIGAWVSGPNGTVAGTRNTYKLDANGGQHWVVRPVDFWIYDPGIYGWVYESPTSGRQAIVYFNICP
jgi:hypothetical protein